MPGWLSDFSDFGAVSSNNESLLDDCKRRRIIQPPLVVELALCDNHWTNQNGGAGDGNPMLMLPPAVRAMQDSGWKLATLARPSKNETQTVQTLRALNVWEIISNLSIKHTQKSKWTIRLFRASVKIVCSPNSLEALKEWGTGGFDAKFVPLTLLGSFALQKTAGWGGGTIF